MLFAPKQRKQEILSFQMVEDFAKQATDGLCPKIKDKLLNMEGVSTEKHEDYTIFTLNTPKATEEFLQMSQDMNPIAVCIPNALLPINVRYFLVNAVETFSIPFAKDVRGTFVQIIHKYNPWGNPFVGFTFCRYANIGQMQVFMQRMQAHNHLGYNTLNLIMGGSFLCTNIFIYSDNNVVVANYYR